MEINNHPNTGNEYMTHVFCVVILSWSISYCESETWIKANQNWDRHSLSLIFI